MVSLAGIYSGWVLSDLVGETGLRIMQAIVAGQRDPKALVKLRDKRCTKSTVAEMEAALTGTYDEEQVFILRQSLESWQFYQEQMAECDQRIEQALAAIPKAPRRSKRRRCGLFRPTPRRRGAGGPSVRRKATMRRRLTLLSR